ncbi:MAG: hypothetical protein WC321_07085, partial [Candidatus Omnitrophota bacterium]
MLARLRKSKAQTAAEYAILIALVIGAAMAMQIYVKRGLQGRIKDVVDHTGSGGDVGGANLTLGAGQYEPYYLTSEGTTTQETKRDITTLKQGGGIGRDSEVETQ